VATLVPAPFWIVLQKLDIEPIQAAGRPDVKSVLGDLLDGADACERQEETEMVRKILVSALNTSKRDLSQYAGSLIVLSVFVLN
jgi:hypothetical protein